MRPWSEWIRAGPPWLEASGPPRVTMRRHHPRTLPVLHDAPPPPRAFDGMSDAATRGQTRTASTHERRDRWIASLVSALLHVLALLALLYAAALPVTTPPGAESGSRMRVDFIGESRDPATPGPPSPAPTRAPHPRQSPVASSPVQSTLVEQSDDPVPPAAPTAADGRAPAPTLPATEPPSVSPPQPAAAADEDARRQVRAPAANPPASTQRRPRVWGQPPGLLREDRAPVNAGWARSPTVGHGRGNQASSSDSNLEAGGYQVYYQLLSEERLRGWRDRGITEVFLPLPGTTRYLVCPLETALRRESGPCRLLPPDSPELGNIGDAREVISMQQVFRRGEALWRGPGPYR